MIAIATSKDLPVIFKMLMALEAETNFCKPKFEHFGLSWTKFIESDLGVIYHDGSDGFIAGFISPEINSGILMAVESLWYVQPSMRKHGLGKRLLLEFEKWAVEKNAKYIVTAKPFKRLKINGYRSLETFLVKEI